MRQKTAEADGSLSADADSDDSALTAASCTPSTSRCVRIAAASAAGAPAALSAAVEPTAASTSSIASPITTCAQRSATAAFFSRCLAAPILRIALWPPARRKATQFDTPSRSHADG